MNISFHIMKQQIIYISGPSNAGKSTAVSGLMKKYPRFFHIHIDRIKWLISDYSNTNTEDYMMLQQMLGTIAKIALDKGLSLFVEWRKSLQDMIFSMSEGKGIEAKYVNIEAPLSVLKERFFERVENAQREGRRLGNTSVEKLIALYDEYQHDKTSTWITLDTSILSGEEVVAEIEKYMWT